MPKYFVKANGGQLLFQNAKKAKTIRRFCVVEGLYVKTGDMCPLNEIATICRQHKVRLFVDEQVSFAAIGQTGRGITEHLGVDVSQLLNIVSWLISNCNSLKDDETFIYVISR